MKKVVMLLILTGISSLYCYSEEEIPKNFSAPEVIARHSAHDDLEAQRQAALHVAQTEQHQEAFRHKGSSGQTKSTQSSDEVRNHVFTHTTPDDAEARRLANLMNDGKINDFTFADVSKITNTATIPQRSFFKRFVDRVLSNYSYRMDVLVSLAQRFKGHNIEGLSFDDIQSLKTNLASSNKQLQKEAQKEISRLYKECTQGSLKAQMHSIDEGMRDALEALQVKVGSSFEHFSFITVQDGKIIFSGRGNSGFKVVNPNTPLSSVEEHYLVQILGTGFRGTPEQLKEWFKGKKTLAEVKQASDEYIAREEESYKAIEEHDRQAQEARKRARALAKQKAEERAAHQADPVKYLTDFGNKITATKALIETMMGDASRSPQGIAEDIFKNEEFWSAYKDLVEYDANMQTLVENVKKIATDTAHIGGYQTRESEQFREYLKEAGLERGIPSISNLRGQLQGLALFAPLDAMHAEELQELVQGVTRSSLMRAGLYGRLGGDQAESSEPFASLQRLITSPLIGSVIFEIENGTIKMYVKNELERTFNSPSEVLILHNLFRGRIESGHVSLPSGDLYQFLNGSTIRWGQVS